MKKYFFFLFALIVLTGFSYGQDWKSYPYQPEGKVIEFPVDEGVHSELPVDWWYLSMHLQGKTTGEYYTIMLTYFHRVIWGFDGFRIFNVTNETQNIFYTETLPVKYDLITEDSLNIIANVIGGPDETFVNQTNPDGTMKPFMYEVSAKQDSASIDLLFDSKKRPLIYGDSGFFYQGEQGNYTYYYALTGLDVTGSITFNGLTEEVTGIAWLDRQYGNFAPSEGEGYEWFSAHLSNGVDIGFYNIFSVDNLIPSNPDFTQCNIYYDDNRDTVIYDFTLTRMDYAYASDTGKCYSQQWHLLADDIDIIVTTIDSTREVYIPFQFYEGATTITGTVAGEQVTGIGFAELLHYYENPQLEFANPDTSAVWYEEGATLSWHVLNRDDGNPLHYSLYSSTDFGESYEIIAENITDTSYYWDFSHLSDGTNCLFKLIGSSVDNTLSDTIVSDTIQLFVVTGIEKPLEKPSAFVYPNPGTGIFHIEGNNIDFLSVRNISGQLLYQQTFPAKEGKEMHTLDLSGHPNGIYFLHMRQHDAFTVQKIILNK